MENILMSHQREPDNSYMIRKFPLKTGDGYEFIEVESIASIKSQNKYSEISTISNKKIKIYYSLKQIEEKFPEVMLRIHRNTLININNILRMEKWTNGNFKIIMQNNSIHEISKRRLNEVKKVLLIN